MLSVYQNDVVYIGQFSRQEQPHGIGKVFVNSQSIEFHGEFTTAKYMGYGSLSSNQYGYKFEGDFVQNYISGFGIEQWKDKSIFKGVFSNDNKAIGVYTWPDNSIYEGCFKENLFHGPVSLLYIIE